MGPTDVPHATSIKRYTLSEDLHFTISFCTTQTCIDIMHTGLPNAVAHVANSQDSKGLKNAKLKLNPSH